MKFLSLLVLGSSLFLASCGHMGGHGGCCKSGEQCDAKKEQCEMKKKDCKTCEKGAKDCAECKECKEGKASCENSKCDTKKK